MSQDQEIAKIFDLAFKFISTIISLLVGLLVYIYRNQIKRIEAWQDKFEHNCRYEMDKHEKECKDSYNNLSSKIGKVEDNIKDTKKEILDLLRGEACLEKENKLAILDSFQKQITSISEKIVENVTTLNKLQMKMEIVKLRIKERG
jgi:hypothetical protein